MQGNCTKCRTRAHYLCDSTDMINTMEPLEEAHSRLTPRFSAAGFELVELVSSEGSAPAWVEYRLCQDGATYLLAVTTTSDSGLLVEFWRASTDGHPLEVLE